MWLTTMWPAKLSAMTTATSVHVSAARGQTRISAPSTKSSWSNGIQAAPGATRRRRLKKLFPESPSIAPVPMRTPRSSQWS